MQRQHAHCRTRFSEAKLEMAEEVLDLSNRNIQLTMELLIDTDADAKRVLLERADNIARMATLVGRIKDQVESEQEKELFEAASARWSSAYNYSQTLHPLIDRNKNEVGKAMANTMLPLLVDNASWRAFVQFLRVQVRAGEGDKELDSRVTHRTIEFVRANRELKTAVAEHKRVTEKLSQLQSIVDCSNDAIIIHTLDGSIVTWNTAAENIYGYSASEVVGHPRSLLLQSHQTDELPEIVETLKRGGKVQLYQGAHVRKDGQRIDVSVMFSPVKDANETVIGAAAIVRDITRQKALEAQLRQSQKMECVGRLSGGIAHDFNNLLGVILAYGGILEDRVDGSAEMAKCVDEIKKASQRAAGLTQQLLAFSRQQVLEPKVLNLNNVITDTSEMLLRLIGEDIEFKTVLQPDLGRVKADQGQVEQAIMNLAVNAREAMASGGKLTIETANVFVHEASEQHNAPIAAGHYVMLVVTDTGVGMDNDTQSRIFEPFFTTKDKDKGTGLGLPVVYGVVKQSGGHIMVSSEAGKGTAFQIYLPLVHDTAEEKEPVNFPQSRKGSETILLVENEDSLRMLTRGLLVKSGYTVLEAGNRGEALELASKHRGNIDLLLTNVVLSGDASGTALASEISRECPGVDVLFMSGYTANVLAVQTMLDEGAFLLQKPFEPHALRKKVREVLDSRVYSEGSR
jgi:two-component system, cell cycle sensor histidine kinase and response regulator CckA